MDLVHLSVGMTSAAGNADHSIGDGDNQSKQSKHYWQEMKRNMEQEVRRRTQIIEHDRHFEGNEEGSSIENTGTCVY